MLLEKRFVPMPDYVVLQLAPRANTNVQRVGEGGNEIESTEFMKKNLKPFVEILKALDYKQDQIIPITETKEGKDEVKKLKSAHKTCTFMWIVDDVGGLKISQEETEIATRWAHHYEIMYLFSTQALFPEKGKILRDNAQYFILFKQIPATSKQRYLLQQFNTHITSGIFSILRENHSDEVAQSAVIIDRYYDTHDEDNTVLVYAHLFDDQPHVFHTSVEDASSSVRKRQIDDYLESELKKDKQTKLADEDWDI